MDKLYRIEKRRKFSPKKGKMKSYYIVIHKNNVCGQVELISLAPNLRVELVPYKFNTKEKAKEYIKYKTKY